MDANRLLIFREIARTGSIAGAARALGWTQPAVSQHLRHLERQAGAPLVLRRPRGVQLTEAGRALLRHADAIAARLQAAEEDLDALGQRRAGTVRLAVFPSAGATIVPDAISLLGRRHAGIDVRLREAEPPQALALLEAGEVDVAVTFTHTADPIAGEQGAGPGLVRVVVGGDPVRLVLPDDHPHAGPPGAPVDLKVLAGEKWIAGCERCAANLREACGAAGFAPDVRHGTDDYVAAQALIARGLAVGLLPQLALDAALHPGVAVRPALQLRPRTLHLTYHREAGQIPAVAGALRALLDTTAGRRTA
ncbi:LysR family transcriptional regulator [Nonomuraea salmonea]|jgi:molybdate transport repressor ModE-like protein|uniref:LysR family transcriptional regulator n=1 Tax=Nonomuraea salmonea TaxID=46181 RepID=A0ABV5NFQ9_9ACTN